MISTNIDMYFGNNEQNNESCYLGSLVDNKCLSSPNTWVSPANYQKTINVKEQILHTVTGACRDKK